VAFLYVKKCVAHTYINGKIIQATCVFILIAQRGDLSRKFDTQVLIVPETFTCSKTGLVMFM
jgi:hypothetical protein